MRIDNCNREEVNNPFFAPFSKKLLILKKYFAIILVATIYLYDC